MVRSVCLLLQNTDKTAWSDKHMRDFLNNNNKKAKQQEKTTDKLQVGSGEMNELSLSFCYEHVLSWKQKTEISCRSCATNLGKWKEKHLLKTLKETL